MVKSDYPSGWQYHSLFLRETELMWGFFWPVYFNKNSLLVFFYDYKSITNFLPYFLQSYWITTWWNMVVDVPLYSIMWFFFCYSVMQISYSYASSSLLFISFSWGFVSANELPNFNWHLYIFYFLFFFFYSDLHFYW